MISIKQAVENVINEDFEGKNAMARKVLNLSQYARIIQKDVAKQAKKDVSIQSIVVTLSRLEGKLKAYNYLPEVIIRQLSVHTPIVQIIFIKNKKNLSALTVAINNIQTNEDVFFSFSTSTRDIAIVASSSIEKQVMNEFNDTPKILKRDLAAVSIRFDEELVEHSGVGFSLLHKVSSRRVPLDAAITTYNEFTLVFETEYLNKVIEVLKPH
jgi:hypothetical protein